MTYRSEAEANEFNGSARLVVGLLFLVSLAVVGYAVHLNALLSNRLGMAVMVMQSQERRIADLERLYSLPLFDGPPTWQAEVAAVEDAFDRSGAKPTWPDDEPGNIGPMAAAMEAEIARLRLTDAERSAIADAADYYAEITPESAETAATLRGLLERMK